MNTKKQFDYHTKITSALQTIFYEQSEDYIDVFDEEFNANDFFHTLATRVPQMIFAKLTGQELDPLEFNHVCNKLIMQDRVDNQQITAK
tara:strand:+ start:1847 stop:2113 length:267 start_codon:yes stop_codon:yes gene_type:complete